MVNAVGATGFNGEALTEASEGCIVAVGATGLIGVAPTETSGGIVVVVVTPMEGVSEESDVVVAKDANEVGDETLGSDAIPGKEAPLVMAVINVVIIGATKAAPAIGSSGVKAAPAIGSGGVKAAPAISSGGGAKIAPAIEGGGGVNALPAADVGGVVGIF